MRFFIIALNEKYLMAINFIASFYIYTEFIKSFMLTHNELYDFCIDIVFISLFSYIGTIATLISIIILIYTIYIHSTKNSSFSIFNKLEAVAITIEHIEKFKNMQDFQKEFDEILLENFK